MREHAHAHIDIEEAIIPITKKCLIIIVGVYVCGNKGRDRTDIALGCLYSVLDP